jgi:tetratricopeptide (TPR) repeat protein
MHSLERLVCRTALLGGMGLLGFAAGAWAQMGGTSQDQLSQSRTLNQASSPTRRAADAASRGARYQRKADKEKDAGKKQELYTKAKAEFTKSLAEEQNFDAFLGLGQVDLALGDTRTALDVCSQAQALKPGDAGAKACIDQATKAASPAPAAAAGQPGQAAATPPPPPG